MSFTLERDRLLIVIVLGMLAGAFLAIVVAFGLKMDRENARNGASGGCPPKQERCAG